MRLTEKKKGVQENRQGGGHCICHAQRAYTAWSMDAWLFTQLNALLHWLALPEHGLGAVFLIALMSATLLPMGSEPAVFAVVQLHPELFWSAVLVATAGNTVGGGISWWMGWYTHRAVEHSSATKGRTQTQQLRALAWLHRFGAKACLLSWLPLVGDPLCAVAGWLRLPFWPCLAYMAVGKCVRYVVMTTALVHTVPTLWATLWG